MIIQFALQDLMILLLCILGFTIGILLLSILWNIKKVVNVIVPLVVTNQECIKKTIKSMPVIFEDVGQTASNVREITSKLKVSVPVILHEVESITYAAKGSIELAGVVMENVGSGINETVAAYRKDTPNFIENIHIIGEVLQIVYRYFFSSK